VRAETYRLSVPAMADVPSVGEDILRAAPDAPRTRLRRPPIV
jgi:hypothetical protein